MTPRRRFLIVLTVVSFLAVTGSMNTYAGKKEETHAYIVGGVGVGTWLLLSLMGDHERARDALEETKETLEGIEGDYVAGQETLPLTKHLNRLNAIEFVGPESHGLASQQDNSGVTYSLFEW